MSNPTSEPHPRLIYDGDCAFCTYWARYWERLTGDAVRYEPYQAVGHEFPQISPERFRRAVQFVAPDGRVAEAAEASFLTLAQALGKGHWLALYRRLPGFAWLTERAYALIAAHRDALYRPGLILWGRDPEPPRYEQVTWLFLRLFGLIYLAAFVSLGTQIVGLAGGDGILPLAEYLADAHAREGDAAYWRLPTLFWIDASDAALFAACLAGAGAALALTLNRLPRTMLVALYVLYLSLFYAGQRFTLFQWDLLLLEAGFLAIWLPGGSRVALWLIRWLLFRLMFLSGVVKLASGDPGWQNLTALHFHFETQPLPTSFAWYAHLLPNGVLMAGTAAMLVIELVLPWLIFAPRRLRFLAAGGFVVLQLVISLTGNYGFFNLFTLLLCLTLLDDAALRRLVPGRFAARLREWARPRPGGFAGWTVRGVAVVAIVAGAGQVVAAFQHRGVPPWADWLVEAVAPWRIANTYGVFAVMTTERPEIIVEGSNDGVTWREYAFKYKPGDVRRAPPWNIPHQPRLDWQMWFAAQDTQEQNPWFGQFVVRLLQGSPAVLALLEDDPFPAAPPRYVRAMVYEYRFTDAAGKAGTGQWWTRQLAGIYYPPLSLHAVRQRAGR